MCSSRRLPLLLALAQVFNREQVAIHRLFLVQTPYLLGAFGRMRTPPTKRRDPSVAGGRLPSLNYTSPNSTLSGWDKVSAVARRLVAKGQPVRGLVRIAEKGKGLRQMVAEEQA